MGKIENVETDELNIIVETHIFTTLRHKNEADNGFSGNVALLIEAIQHSDKVLDEDLKLLAKGIFTSVIKHKIIKHSEDDIKKAIQEKKDQDAKTEINVEK